MNDFNKLISTTLTEQAGHAPVAVGLAEGARLRHRHRRRRAAVGVAAGMLAVVGPLALVLGDSEDAPEDRGLYADDSSGVSGSAEAWQRVKNDAVSVEIPNQWRSFDCATQTAFPAEEIYGPSEQEACSLTVFAAFVDRDGFERIRGHAPGQVYRHTPGPHDVRWGGHLYAGGQILAALTPERGLTSHILNSVTGTDIEAQRREAIVDSLVNGHGLPAGQADCAADSLLDAGLSERQLRAVPEGVNLMIPEGESDWVFVFNNNRGLSKVEAVELNTVLGAQATDCLRN